MATKPSVRFALPSKPKSRPPFSVKRVYGAILLVWAILVMGVVRMGRDRVVAVGRVTVLGDDVVGGYFSGEGVVRRDLELDLGPGGDGDVEVWQKNDEECRLVHSPSVKNKCAFIRQNCPDEEAGLFSYLQLYYCRIPHLKPVAFIILLIWLCVLFSTIGIAASDFLCINLSTIASILGMSESLAGVTFLAFGNGSPDVFSTFAAMSSHSGSLAVGELVGAASFISAVVAGSMAITRPFKVARRTFIRDVGFFVFAAAFSMFFLADGRLLLWECAVMVGFYGFYVFFVVVWHWYVGRRKKRMDRNFAARSQFQSSDHQELDIEASSEEEDVSSGERRALSSPGFGALETPSTPNLPAWKINDEELDEETRERYLIELRDEMQLSRPGRRRRNTIAPIRPSLIGALDFKSTVQTLERNNSHLRNRGSIESPISLRRYSDDPGPQSLNVPSSVTGPGYFDHGNPDLEDEVARQISKSSVSGRSRAVSANDAKGLKLDTTILRKDNTIQSIPEIDLLGPETEEDHNETESRPFGRSQILHSPRFSLSPPHSEHSSRASSPGPPGDRTLERDYLAPPSTDFYNPNYRHPHQTEHSPLISPRASPRLAPQVPRIDLSHSSSRSQSPIGSPQSLPKQIDDDIRSIRSIRSMSRAGSVSLRGHSRAESIQLPSPSLSPDTVHPHVQFEGHDFDESKPLRWWPHRVLPPPQVLFSTLFPTLYDWMEKNVWERCLGLVAAPSVFLLTITLPVVEPCKEDEEIPDPDPGCLSPEVSGRQRSRTLSSLSPDSPTQAGATTTNGYAGRNSSKSATNVTKSPLVTASKGPPNLRTTSDPHPHTASNPPVSSPKEWNRWLVSTQLVLSPLFVVIIVWANIDETLSTRNLIRPVLFALLASLVLLALLLYTTTPTSPPHYRPLFCFLGFIVSIAWISTIANEVVGVLKAFGVILGISDAILGLTIFAVGNSLGDLVADITVARLGYPVMALSACFGGPMLNILLGIGCGGLYMTIKGANKKHEHHPKRPIAYKPYEIEVSTTLLISGITLLVTLLGLLVVVPMNKWKMDRKVGWGLVTLWGLSTIGNVAVEVAGYGGDLALFLRQ